MEGQSDAAKGRSDRGFRRRPNKSRSIDPPFATPASGQIERYAEESTKNGLTIYVLANARTSSLTASRCCSFLILATLRTTLSNIRSCSVICSGPSCPVSSKKYLITHDPQLT